MWIYIHIYNIHIIYVCVYIYIYIWDGFVVGAGFWGFVGSSWQQMFIFCTVMPSYACCQRYCCKISSIWYIYIYMHTSKISSSWVTRNKTYCTCTARNYITLSTVLCHLASEYQREKINFALLRHAQMIGFCLLLGFYSKHEQEETVLLIDRRFHFVPKQYCIFQSSLHKEIWCFASPLRKCKARPWDVHSIPLEQVRSVFHIF